MKGKHPIDEQLFKLFGEMEASVPEAAWDRLASDLDRRRKRKVALWLGMSLTGVVLLLGVSLCLFLPCDKNKVEVETHTAVNQAPQKNELLQFENGSASTKADVLEAEQPRLRINLFEKTPKNKVLANKRGLDESLPVTRSSHEELPSMRARLNLNLFNSSVVFYLPDKIFGVSDFSPSFTTSLPDAEKQGHLTWYLGLHANAGYLTNNITTLKGYESFINRAFYEIMSAAENGTYQINYGGDLSLKFKNGLMLSTGLNTALRQQDYHYRYSIVDFPVVDRNQGITAYLPLAPADQVHVDKRSSNTQYFVEIPVHFEYTLLRIGKISAGLRSGVNMGYAFEPRGLLPDETTLLPEDLTKKMRSGWNAAGHIGVTLNYEAGKRFLFTAEPSLMKNFTGLTQEQAYIQSNPNIRGLNLRLLYKLNP